MTLPVKPREYAPSVNESVLFGPLRDCWWLVEVLQQDGKRFSVQYRGATFERAAFGFATVRPAPANMADQQARDQYRLDPARSAAVCDRLRLRLGRRV